MYAVGTFHKNIEPDKTKGRTRKEILLPGSAHLTVASDFSRRHYIYLENNAIVEKKKYAIIV
jgi:hypothetical protein